MIDTLKQKKEEIIEKLILDHCRCCDFSKHFYDDHISQALDSYAQIVREEIADEIKGKSVSKIEDEIIGTGNCVCDGTSSMFRHSSECFRPIFKDKI